MIILNISRKQGENLIFPFHFSFLSSIYFCLHLDFPIDNTGGPSMMNDICYQGQLMKKPKSLT